MSEYNVEKAKRENAALRRYAAIQKATEERLCVQKIYVDIAGGIEEAFILDELIFFTLPRPETGRSGLRVRKEGVLWMAVSRTEWWERKRLTAKQADGAIEKLVEKNLVFKELFLFNKQKTTHLRLNIEEFFKRYSEELEKQNPPEDEDDTILKDINDLYEMMGVPNKDTSKGILKGDTVSPKGEEVSLNGDSINSPNTTLTQSLRDDLEKNLSIENAIFLGKEVTEENLRKQSIKDTAPKMFEKALGFSKPLPWWSNKEWSEFSEWVCDRHTENRMCFGEYNIWRNTPFVKGTISNNRIRGFVNEFYDSWDMFTMSKKPREESNRPEHQPFREEESHAVPNPYEKPRILRKPSSLDS